MKKIIIILFVAWSPMLLAQDNDLLRDLNMSKKAEWDRYLESAFKETREGNYKTADIKYREIFASIKNVSSDLCFYFGKNSFYLDEYYQSLDWLNKYIELKGTGGKHFEEAKQLIKWNKEALKIKRSMDAVKAKEILSKEYTIDCGPSGMITCPVCEGETVIIKKSAFGNEYKTCPFCNKDGLLTCEEYNKLLRGELKNYP